MFQKKNLILGYVYYFMILVNHSHIKMKKLDILEIIQKYPLKCPKLF